MLVIRHNKYLAETSRERSTVVLEKPDPREIMQAMRKQFTLTDMSVPAITVNIGAAFASPRDSFKKKVGRALAEARMKPLVCTITLPDSQNINTAIYLDLQGIDDETKVLYTIHLLVYRDSKKLRIMKVTTKCIKRWF